MKNYKLIIFDLDGTLLDTTNGVVESVIYTVRQLGLPEFTYKEYLSFIGPPIPNSFSNRYELAGEDLKHAVTIFRDKYYENTLFEAEPYPHIFDVFTYFKNNDIHTAVATYKVEYAALKVLQHFHFDDYTDIIFGADTENRLSKSDIIMKCVHKFNYPKEQVLMIGDTMHDAKGAENLDIDFLAVTYGFGFKKGEDLSQIKHVAVADTPLEIMDWFNV
ncbi:MAG: HAD hydrolase-like protein [Bacteroidales bacterium]|nr:HAD hydrolase-like protein [Bacteroidales bacterium]